PGGGEHRGGEVAGLGVGAGKQVGDHLGVGLGAEGHAGVGQLGPQGVEVLDDAVVDHREAAVVGQVRVGVQVGGCPVGGPPGVPDRGGAVGQRVLGQLVDQVGELAGLLR